MCPVRLKADDVQPSHKNTIAEPITMSSLSRREFLQMLAAASAAGMGIGCTNGAGTGSSTQPGNLYKVAPFGSVSLLHFTDCHAQLKPIYFREPSINIGVSGSTRKAPPAG